MSARLTTSGTAGPRVLIIIQNLHVPFDRRVWLECRALRDAGYDVVVVCPAGPGSLPHEVIDGVEVFTYRSRPSDGSTRGFVAEYAHSFVATARLALRARHLGGRFDVLQACNPPDIFWPLARWLRLRDGSRFVFDHHDLCPELYRSRFGDGSSLPLRGLLALERATFRAADRVISTNGSYKGVAIERGGKLPEDVTVVRTGPDAERLRPRPAVPALRGGREHLVAYLGVMGPQDGVDIALSAADLIVNRMGRRDISFTLMGGGECYEALQAQRDHLGLQDYVDLPGRVPDDFVADVLSTADLGLCPDPRNPLNDVSTMNKTMEYMAFRLPVVAFDLHETRVSAGDAATYAEPNSLEAFAQAVVDLIDQPERRDEMGRLGRQRVEQELAWAHQRAGYVAVFDELTGQPASGASGHPREPVVALDRGARVETRSEA